MYYLQVMSQHVYLLSSAILVGKLYLSGKYNYTSKHGVKATLALTVVCG